VTDVSPLLELSGKEYALVDRIRRDRNLGIVVADLMACVVAPQPRLTYKGVRAMLIAGQADLIEEIAKDLGYTLPR
jgi:hypothetical protein